MEDKIGPRCHLHILCRSYCYLSCQKYREWQCDSLGFVYIFLFIELLCFFTTTWFWFVEYSRYTSASCIANISTAGIWFNAWQPDKIQTTKFKNKWIVKELILDLQMRCSSHLVMQQWSNLHPIHTVFAICPDVPQHYKFNTCTVTHKLCYYVFTHVLLTSVQLILKGINLKHQYPRSKLKVIYPKPYYYLTPSKPEIHLNYTYKSSSYLALHHKYQLVRVV
jgi:hypothetical protein